MYSNNIINEKDFQYVAIKEGEKQNVVEYGDVLFTLSSETPEEVGIGSVYLGNENVYLNSFLFWYSYHKYEDSFPSISILLCIFNSFSQILSILMHKEVRGSTFVR